MSVHLYHLPFKVLSHLQQLMHYLHLLHLHIMRPNLNILNHRFLQHYSSSNYKTIIINNSNNVLRTIATPKHCHSHFNCMLVTRLIKYFYIISYSQNNVKTRNIVCTHRNMVMSLPLYSQSQIRVFQI